MKTIIKIILIFSFISALYGDDIIDIDAKVKNAKLENKQIMIFFHIPRCPYCKRMLDKNFHNKIILEQIKKHFILIDIYTIDKKMVKYKNFKGNQKEFSKFIGAKAFPATIFIDENSKTVYKSIGYRNIQEYITEIKYIATKSYQKIDLETFALDLEMNEDD